MALLSDFLRTVRSGGPVDLSRWRSGCAKLRRPLQDVDPRMSLPSNGTQVRARVHDWAVCQANNKEKFPDPRLPTLEGVPEWIEGPLDVRHVLAPWGEVDSVSVLWRGTQVDVEADSVRALG